MNKSADLKKYQKLIIASSIAAALGGISSHASAQSETLTQDIKSIERISVLGSNIRQIDTQSAAPVQYIGRDSIELSSIGSISDLVLNIPANAGSVVNPVSGANIGSSNFNIRNLGSGSTLVLINGRRAGKSPLSDNLGNQFYDLNQLPLSMVKSVDIQTDGASAIYGSEAVAGVVNIVTRKGFEGVEVSARYEDASNQTETINFAFGSNSDRGSFGLYATAYNGSINYRSDFDFIVERSGGALTSSSGSPDEYRTLDPITNEFGSNKVIDPFCAEAGQVVDGNNCRYNFFDHTSPIPKNNRLSIFAEFDYDLGEVFGFEEIKTYGEISYARNTTTRAFGPQINGNGEYNGRFLIPSSHPFNFFVEDANGLQYVDPTTATGAEFWQQNPGAAANLTTSGSFRPIGAAIAGRNGNGNDYVNNSDRHMIGIDAFRGDWSVSAWYQKYEHENRFIAEGDSIASALQAGLMNGTLNPFGIAYALPEFVSPKNGFSTAGHDIERYNSEIGYITINERTSSQQTVDFVVSNGEIFELDAGYLGIAFGYQNRKETFTFTPDRITSSGLGSVASSRSLLVDGETAVDSVFVELAIPAMENLDLQLALRYEDHGEEIGTTTDPKIAALYKLTDDLLLRASFGSSFQAPTAIQTGGITSSAGVDFLTANGQVTCSTNNAQPGDFISDTSARVIGKLSPQSADNFNLGIVWQPTDKSSVSVDYWQYDYKGLIVNAQSAQAVLDSDCNDGILNDPNITRASDGVPLFIATSLENADSAKTDGIDAKFSYGFANDIGTFDVNLTLSYVMSFEAVLSGAKVDVAGRRNANTDSFGTMPELSGNVSAKWAKENHQAIVTFRYTDSYLQDDAARSNSLLGQNINSFTTLDFQYRYDASELTGIESWLMIGANNLTDKNPPRYGARPFFDEEAHSIRGRVLYAEIGVRF
ncbi:MAG: iron complex outermembrane receptor protein [Patiriisocius sp.]|jgi:iron complex outermembrane receptor protein